MPDRSVRTLIPQIESNVLSISLIWTDEWASYISLSTVGYELETVNHSENFIDPVSDANTQKIERVQKDEKICLETVHRPTHLLQSYLDETCWRTHDHHNASDFLAPFLADAAEHYTCTMSQNAKPD